MSRDSHDGAEYQPIDENGDRPVSRAEFHDAMRDVARSFADVESNMAQIHTEMVTKTDLEELATKDELHQLEERIAAKIARLATKEELAALEERLTARMDAQTEAVIKAVTRHIDGAVDRAVQRHIKLLLQRIARLEENAGLSPAA